MLRISHYLQNQSQTESPLTSLKNELGVDHKKHPELDLYILDYSQIDSPRFHPIVDECRGLVIDENYDLVSKGLSRFYNIHEGPDINWKGKIWCTVKQDGSMIHVFNYKGEWFCNTRFSWGSGLVNDSGFTWRQLVEQHLDYSKLDPTKTYVFELCGPYNKVVRQYSPTLFLLAVFSEGQEYPHWSEEYEAERIGIPMTETIEIDSKENAIEILNRFSEKDKTFEGFVIRDELDNRLKLKHSSYLALHRLGTGNAASPKNIVPLVLMGETSELLCYFNEYTNIVKEVTEKISNCRTEVSQLWEESKNITDMKEFAQYILPKTKFTYPLFTAKRNNIDPLSLIDEKFILKMLFD